MTEAHWWKSIQRKIIGFNDIYLVAADWFDDNNKPEIANCLRWCSENKKRPQYGRGRYYYDFTWWNSQVWGNNQGRKNRPEMNPKSDIPADIFVHLKSGNVSSLVE